MHTLIPLGGWDPLSPCAMRLDGTLFLHLECAGLWIWCSKGTSSVCKAEKKNKIQFRAHVEARS